MRNRLHLMRFILALLVLLIGLWVAPRPALAAWGNIQVEVVSTYPMKRVVVAGYNQHNQWKQWSSDVYGARSTKTTNWWWKSNPVLVEITYTNNSKQSQWFNWSWTTPFWYDWQTANFTYRGTDNDNPKPPSIVSPNSSRYFDQQFTFAISPSAANYTGRRDYNVGVEQISGTWRWSSGWTANTSWSIKVPADGQYRLWAQQGDMVSRGSKVASIVIVVKRSVGIPSIKSPATNQFVKRAFSVEINPGSMNYTMVADWLVQCYTNASNPDGSTVAQVGWTRNRTPQIILYGDGVVFCRVRQGDTVNNGSGWSTPVTVRVVGVVNAPKILSPTPNATVSGKRFKVELESVGTPYWNQLEFRIQIARNPSFAPVEKTTEWQRSLASKVLSSATLRASIELEVSGYGKYYIRAQVRNESGLESPFSNVTISVPFFYDRVKATSQDVINAVSASGSGWCTELIQHAFRAGGLPGIDQGFFGGFKTWTGNGYLVKWMEAYPDMWEFRSFQDLEPGDAILYSSIGGNAQNWREVDGNGASKFGHVALVIGKNPAGKTLVSHWNIGGYSGSPRPQGLEYDAYIGGALPVLGIHIRSSGVAASSPSIAPVSAPTFVPPAGGD
ncbi:MAG: hypothetical protein IAE83_21075 [Anaerolinea sp.]|nr:hypothetical protein [Anaerolinea sp.]